MIRNYQELVPAETNGLNLVYMLGYGGHIWHSKRHLKLLLKKGFTIYALDFRDVLRRRNPQDLLTLMDEVDELLQKKHLINKMTLMLGVSMGGLVGFNMLKRHEELKTLLVITGGNMALIPKYYRQKWPVSYDELAELWAPVNIYTKPGEVKNKYIAMALPSRDQVINPVEVADELKMLSAHNTVRILRPKGGHFRTIVTQTMLRPQKSLPIIQEMIAFIK